MATKLQVWHRVKHDGFTVTEILVDEKTGYLGAVKRIARDCGFWDYSAKAWIPYHSISYIAPEEE